MQQEVFCNETRHSLHMGKRTYLTHAALILGLAALVPQCASKPQSWALPQVALQQTPAMPPPIDCAELTADPSIPQFIVEELCGPSPAEATTDAAAAKANSPTEAVVVEDQEEAENAAKEESADAGKPTVMRAGSDGAKEPSEVIVPFFRIVIQKLISKDAQVTPRDFWAKAYQEAGAPKMTRHPTFFEMVAGLQQAVESFRTEDSWWSVVRLIKELTSDRQWKRLEAAMAAAHGRDPGNLWRVIGASKALKAALKSSIKEPECRVEGLNPDPEDCRKFLVCFRRLGRWKSKDTKCPKYTEFSRSRLRCVWAPLSDCERQDSDSDSDSDSDESSREVLERILKHGSGAFHVH